MSRKEQLAAVSEAIKDAGVGLPLHQAEPETPDSDEEPDAPEVTATEEARLHDDSADQPEDAGSSETPDEAGAAEAEAAEPAGEEVGEPSGEGEAAEAKPEEGKESDARPSDEFGELPADTKAETRKRFDTMRGRFDEVAKERDTLKSTLEEANSRIDQMVDVVRRTGADAEQFDALLQYAGARNSNNPALLEQAYSIIKTEFEALSKMLGKPLPGVVNPLEQFPDLLEEVESGGMSRQYAEEIAQSRVQQKLHTEFSTKQQQTTESESHRVQGLQQVQSLGAQLRAEEPEKYKANLETLKAITRLVEQAGGDPRTWAGKIKAEWDRLPAVAKPKPTPTPNPVRPTGMSGAPGNSSLRKEPANAQEAMADALGL